MAQTIDEWVDTHVEKFDNLSPESIYYRAFFRDSCRPCFLNPNIFYSPADGIIIYQKKVKAKDNIIEVKGKNYTLEHLMMSKDFEETDEFYVIGVFMTLYDVHVNRMPYPGYLKFEELDPIESNNLPMIFMEKDIFKGKVDYLNSDYNYLFKNSRMINTVYSPKLDLEYNIVQIADDDVQVIMPFSTKQKEFYSQNDRFSFIRWGSQVDLIVPVTPGLEMEFCQQELMHVTAGIDPLLKVTKIEDDDDEDGDLVIESTGEPIGDQVDHLISKEQV